MNDLSRGERIAGGSGLALFILMFVSWYGVEGTDLTVNAWESFDFIDLVLILTALAGMGVVAIRLTNMSGALPVPMPQLAMGLGALASVLVAYRILNEPGPDEAITLKIGIWLGLLACIGIAYGGREASD